MVEGTRGYPFLIQLVGAQVWRLLSPRARSRWRVRGGRVRTPCAGSGRLVYEPALADASEIDKSFLLAMAKDDGPSRMNDIQQRLEIDANFASQYRLRLIASELIEPTRPRLRRLRAALPPRLPPRARRSRRARALSASANRMHRAAESRLDRGMLPDHPPDVSPSSRSYACRAIQRSIGRSAARTIGEAMKNKRATGRLRGSLETRRRPPNTRRLMRYMRWMGQAAAYWPRARTSTPTRSRSLAHALLDPGRQADVGDVNQRCQSVAGSIHLLCNSAGGRS